MLKKLPKANCIILYIIEDLDATSFFEYTKISNKGGCPVDGKKVLK